MQAAASIPAVPVLGVLCPVAHGVHVLLLPGIVDSYVPLGQVVHPLVPPLLLMPSQPASRTVHAAIADVPEYSVVQGVQAALPFEAMYVQVVHATPAGAEAVHKG